jgi:hypothetical protein
MKDRLPKKLTIKNKNGECGVVNLQDSSGPGTHWVAYYIRNRGSCAYYFDSFGLQPPLEIRRYLSEQLIDKSGLITNQHRIQGANEVICGQYCLFVLKAIHVGRNFFEAVQKLK